MDRTTFLAEQVPRDGFGLEIGPSHAPRFPKSEGYNVETLDHASADELRAKYASAGVDISAIEEVDYVSDGRALHETIPRRAEYDYIFSSHVIEHIPDFIGYIKSCLLLLKPGGSIVLVVPDKRYCFDAFQHPSTTGDILQAHDEGRTRHTAGVAFDFGANMAAMEKEQAWSARQSGIVDFINDLDEARRHYEHTRDSFEYRDYHGWRFTPSSFRLIIHDLHALGIIPVKEKAFDVSDNFEFYVTLSTDGLGSGQSRIELMRSVVQEQVASGLQLLSPFNPLNNVLQLRVN